MNDKSKELINFISDISNNNEFDNVKNSIRFNSFVKNLSNFISSIQYLNNVYYKIENKNFEVEIILELTFFRKFQKDIEKGSYESFELLDYIDSIVFKDNKNETFSIHVTVNDFWNVMKNE